MEIAEYRKAYNNFSDALHYNSTDIKLEQKKDLAYAYAKKTISIAPFFNETHAINDQFKNLFQAMSLKSPLPSKVYKSQIMINSENFLEQIHTLTLELLNEKKSVFLTIEPYQNDSVTILIAGALTLIEDDRINFPETEIKTGFIDYKSEDINSDLWLTDNFSYEVITKRYRLNVKSDLRFYKVDQSRPFHKKALSDYASQIQTTRGKMITPLPAAVEYKFPNEYQILQSREQPFTKDYVVKEVIHNVATSLSDYIIQTIDQ